MTQDEAAKAVEPILTRFVVDQLLYDRESPKVEPDEPLLGSLLDSMDILNLVEYVEQQFGIKIADDELVPENFETLRRVAGLIASKRESQG